MMKIKRAFLVTAAAAAIAILPLAPAMAGGHGFRPHGFEFGRGLVGAAVALVTLPLTIAAAVVTGGESLAAYPAPGYGPAYAYGPGVSYAGPRPYYGPGYYAQPRGYAPRSFSAPRAGGYGRGYHRGGGDSYPHR